LNSSGARPPPGRICSSFIMACYGAKENVIKGPFREKLDLLLKNGITLAAWHLPLDKHPVVGNNARIMKMLGAGGFETVRRL